MGEDLPGETKALKESPAILIAEDSPVMAMIADRFFSRKGCDTLVARNGKIVLRSLADGNFDLVLMDVEMPEMGGLEATRRIREGEAGERNRMIPIIAMTAHGLSEFRKRCAETGMNDFVSKPVDFERLFCLVEEILLRSKSDQGLVHTENERPKALALLNHSAFLRRLGGNQTLQRKVLAAFQAQAEPTISHLRNAVFLKQWYEASRIAHDLKGTCGTIGAESCSDLSALLEEACRKEETETILRLCLELEKMIGKVVRVIEKMDKA